MARDLSAQWRKIAGPYTILRVLGQGLEFLAFVVFARSLTPAEFGLVSVGYVIARYGALIADWGVSVRGPRDVARGSAGEITALVRHRERVALGLTLVYVAACFVLGEPELAPLAALILAAGMTRDWVALGHEAGLRSAAPSVVRGALVLVGAVMIGSVAGASWALAAGAVGGGLISVALNRVGPREAGAARLNDPWILIATVMAQIYISLDILLLAWLRSDTQAGIYAAVYRIPNAWITVNGLLVAALLPVATRQLRADPARLRSFVRRDWRIGAGFGAVIVVLSPLGAWLVAPLFGDAYSDGQLALVLLCVATGISTITSLLGTTYLVVGSDRSFATALAAGAGINILVNLAVIPLWGMTGAAIATIVSELLVLVIIAGMLGRLVRGGVARMSSENFVFFGLDRTGGVIVLARYLHALAARGDQVSITTLGRAGDDRFLALDADVPVRYLGLRSLPYKAAVRFTPGHLGFPSLEQRRLAAALPDCDLHVATYSLTASVVAAANAPGLYHAQHFEPLIMQYPRARRLAEESYRLPLYLTANCTWVADRIVEAGGAVRGLVMPGIDHDVFSPAPVPRPEDGRFRVVTLAKRADWKGLVDVVAGIAQLARSSPTAVDLVAYGPDQLAGDASPATVEHHGLVAADVLADLLRGADACVSGSWYESFPLPPLEGMACGTPVICTRLGTEDYAVHEQNCLIVPPRDADAIHQALERIRDDTELRSELVRNGLETARRFSWPGAEAEFLRHVDAAQA